MHLRKLSLILTGLFLVAGCKSSGEDTTSSDGSPRFIFAVDEGEYMGESYVLKNTVFKFEGISDTTKITVLKYDDLASYLGGGSAVSTELTFDFENQIFDTAHDKTAIVGKNGSDKYTFYYEKTDSGRGDLYVKGLDGMKPYTVKLVKDEYLPNLESAYNAPGGKYYSQDSVKLYDSTHVDDYGKPELEGEYIIQVNIGTNHKLAGYYNELSIGGASNALTSYTEMNSFSAIGVFNDFEPLAIKDYDEANHSFKVVLERGARPVFAYQEITVVYGGAW
ncbi:MAG: hypothetical protein SPL75_01775 [Bacilli bacterium]|nr:hypothetical protein [Bacilli bacterium]